MLFFEYCNALPHIILKNGMVDMDKSKTFFIKYSIITLIIGALICITVILAYNITEQHEQSSYEATDATPITVIIDAGHGGEDGGTQSKDGLLEKDLNLDIAERLSSLLSQNGVNVIMTRSDDRLLYNKSSDHKGRKKALDVQARLKIANDNPDAIFISIHQNYFSRSEYSGLQVWYSGNNTRSMELAEYIQKSVKNTLQPNNNRQTKLAGSNIYLLEHIKNPTVLIECGFLSNPDEARKLSDPSYRQNLSEVICRSVIEYIKTSTKA